MKKIYVDGYNLIFRIPTLSRVQRESPARAREMLSSLLQRYAASKKTEMYVVYDSRERETGEQRFLAGYRFEEIFVKDADRYLRNITEKNAENQDITVVSSDINDVVRPAKAYGAKVMTAEEFFRLLENCERRSKTQPEKPPPPTGEELEQWLEIFKAKRK